MLKILKSLLGRSKPETKRPKANPFAIEVGPDDDPDLRIMASPRARYPKKRGKTPEQFQADLEAFHAELRFNSAASFRLTRKRALSVGSRFYIWRSDKSDECLTCRSRIGKKFSWNREPEHGHAGLASCCERGWCICYAEPAFD